MIDTNFINELYNEEIESREEYRFQRKISSFSESDQQLLQEMYFSKKDLQNPKTIKKIEEILKVTYDDIYVCIITILFILPIVISIIINPVLVLPGVIGGLALSITVLLYTCDLVKNMPQKAFDKNYKKFKEKVTKLKEKTQEKLDKNPGKNDSKYKEIITNCDKVLDIIQEREKKIIKENEEKDYEYVKYLYTNMIKFLEYPFNCGFEGEDVVGKILLMMKKYLKISESQFIQRMKKVKFKKYTLEQAIIDWYRDKNIKTIEDVKNSSNPIDYGNANLKINVIEILSNDDNVDYIGQDGKVYSIQTDDKLYIESFFKNYNSFAEYQDVDIIKKYIVEVDKELGYYSLSESPKNVKKK